MTRQDCTDFINDYKEKQSLTKMVVNPSIWWYNVSSNNLRLNDAGFDLFKVVFGRPPIALSSCCLVLSPKILLKLNKLECPYYLLTGVGVFRNMIMDFYLFGREEGIWLALSDNNIEYFLDNWIA